MLKLIGIFLAIIVFSCNRSSNVIEKNNQLIDSVIDSLIHKHNCRREYDFARLFLYSSYYLNSCIGTICEREDGTVYTAPVGNKRLPSTNIRLDLTSSMPIQENGDTIIFRISAFITNKNNIECKCRHGIQYALPSGVSMIKGTNVIIESISYNGVNWMPSQKDVARIINNPSMIDFVKKNKSSVNEWYYNQILLVHDM